MTLPKSVSAYADECEAVLSWLSADVWLDQCQFDRKSLEWKLVPDRPSRLHHFTGDAIIPPMCGDLNLAILQEMMRAGLVQARRRKSRIEYRLATHDKAAA